MQRGMREADLAIVAKEDPAALGVQGRKLLEAAQLAVGQGRIQLGVQGLGIVPRWPARIVCTSMVTCRLCSFLFAQGIQVSLFYSGESGDMCPMQWMWDAAAEYWADVLGYNE